MRWLEECRNAIHLGDNLRVMSAELSLGKIRLISSQCQVILTNLQETVQAQGNYSLPRLKKGKGGLNNYGSAVKSDQIGLALSGHQDTA